MGLNEISSRGFQVLCDALPYTKIEAFACGKNLLNENNIIKHFCKVLPRTHLSKFDLSQCRLNDADLLSVIESLPGNARLQSIRMADNFFSEKIE